MRTIHSLIAGLGLAVSAGAQWPCDSLVQASFIASPGPGGTVHFQNTSAGMPNATSSFWSFGDGGTSMLASPTHAYAQPGTYMACLSLVSGNCFDSTCTSLTIGGGPSPCDGLNAGFQVTTDGLEASFHTSGPPNGQVYSWSFGDGTSGQGPAPSHTYASGGQYHACLTVWTWDPTTQDTCFADHCEWVMVQGGGSLCDSLDAAFDALVNGSVVHFIGTWNPPGVHYQWSFGDGTWSDNATPTHAYGQPGTYLACLTVFDPQAADTCKRTRCKPIVIGDGNSPCDSTFSVSFSAMQQGGQAVFTASSSGPPAVYFWSFGDDASGWGQTVDHHFAPGEHLVCVQAWYTVPGTIDTCSAHACQSIIVQGNGSPCDSLDAGFQVTTSGLTATFHNNPGNNGQAYHWSFGDGTSGWGALPTHTYATPGQYHACLTVWTWDPMTQDTCFADHCEWVMLQGGHSPCDSLFQVSYTYGQQGPHVAFHAQATGDGVHYSWSFGDGTVGTGPNIEHTYAPGEYYACVRAWAHLPGTLDTCFAEYCHWIHVEGDGSPCDSLNADFQVTTDGLAATFHQAPGNSGQIYHWSFGDGTFSDEPMPMHTYAAPGQYHACLVVWAWNPMTQDTCVADHCAWVAVQGGNGSPCDSLLQAAFAWTPGDAAIFFQDQSTTNGIPVAHYWDFGDGSVSDTPDPIHHYAQPGPYLVCLTIFPLGATDSCSSTVCRWVSPFGGGSPCDSLLSAAFTVTPGDASLFFQDQSATNGIPVGYHWDLGDGSTSDEQDPIHLYAQPGLYPVCLTIFPIGGMDSCSSTVCHWVDAFGGNSGPCDSLVVPSFDWNVEGGVVALWSTSFGNGLPVSYSWTMDNVALGAGPQVIYQPSGPGELLACMTATLYGPDQAILCTTTVCDTVLFNGIVTGVSERSGGPDLNTYPQPFTDRLTVRGDGLSGGVRFTLMDMAGRVVDDRQLSVQGSTVLDYAAQPLGPYLLRVRTAAGERTLRVLKQ